MLTLQVMNPAFDKLGEIAQYQSLSMTRSYCGTGSFDLTMDPRLPNALTLMPDAIVFPSGEPHKAFLIEDITLTRTKLQVKGCMLKGLAKRRVCVPPLTLPARLWRYDGATETWEEVTDTQAIRQAITGGTVYQGFTRPPAPSHGMLFLDMTELGAVYDWGTSLGLGGVVSDLEEARLRSQYQNFGWDRFSGDAESALLHYAMNNMISPEDASRAIPGLIPAANLHRGLSLPWQARFTKLDAMLENIGEATGLGWDIRPDLAAKQLVFGAWEGLDRTTGPALCLIDEKNGNADQVTQKRTSAGSATTAYVGGAGEDENRFILSVGGTEEGLSRRELWVEAGSIDDADLLRLYGQNKLDAAAPKNTLTAELIDSGACRYGRDYDVGDLVIVRDGYGNSQAVRVAELTEVHENGKRSLRAAFGNAPITPSAVFARTGSAAR